VRISTRNYKGNNKNNTQNSDKETTQGRMTHTIRQKNHKDVLKEQQYETAQETGKREAARQRNVTSNNKEQHVRIQREIIKNRQLETKPRRTIKENYKNRRNQQSQGMALKKSYKNSLKEQLQVTTAKKNPKDTYTEEAQGTFTRKDNKEQP